MTKWQGYSLNLCNITYFKKEKNSVKKVRKM